MTNREIIQGLYDAFARGDAPAVLGTLHDDVDWNEAKGSPLADGNPYASPPAVGDGVFGRILSNYEGFQAAPHTLVADGDHVVALGTYSGTRTTSGATLDAPFAHAWTLRDGKVSAFQQYTDTAQWRDQMG